jgi:hypothetical protein
MKMLFRREKSGFWRENNLFLSFQLHLLKRIIAIDTGWALPLKFD